MVFPYKLISYKTVGAHNENNDDQIGCDKEGCNVVLVTNIDRDLDEEIKSQPFSSLHPLDR